MVQTVSKSAGAGGGGGGGGFPAEATQNATNSPVSITSTSNDSGAGSNAIYRFSAEYNPDPGIATISAYLETSEITSGNQTYVFAEGSSETGGAQISLGVGVQNNGLSQSFETIYTSDLNNKQTGIRNAVQDGVVVGSAEIITYIEGGVVKTALLLTDSEFVLEATAEAGAETVTINTDNGPAAGLQITNWVKITLNGVEGYLPFFSTPP
jgi:hypothetical protein